jgi:hypothetical protein
MQTAIRERDLRVRKQFLQNLDDESFETLLRCGTFSRRRLQPPFGLLPGYLVYSISVLSFIGESLQAYLEYLQDQLQRRTHNKLISFLILIRM